MPSKVQICNLALLRLGQAQIQDLEEKSTEANYCNALYDDVRKEVLRDHSWNFATAIATPAVLSDENPPDWAYVYNQPSKCLRVIELIPAATSANDVTTLGWADSIASSNYFAGSVEGADDTIPMEVRGDKILTNALDIAVKYTYDITDPTLFDSLFVTAFSYRLAADLAMPITGDLTKQQAMFQMYERLDYKAAGKDATEGRKIHKQTFLEARN